MTSRMLAENQGTGRFLPYLLFFGVCLALQGGLVVSNVLPVLDGQLLGTDGYMRLVRVTELHETGAWFDGRVARSNAPYGEVLHWTRPLDVLLLAGAWALKPFFGFKSGLYWSGALVSPMLWALACLAFAWASEPFFARDRRSLAMIAFLVQPAVIAYSLAGRADHHALILLIFVVSLGLTVRVLSRPYRAGLAIAAGAAAGLGIWVSVEFLAALAVAFAATSLAWVLSGGDGARKNLAYALGLAAMLALALVAERPLGQLLVEEYDRVSLVHLAVALLALGFWGGVRLIERRGERPRGAPGRLIVAALGAAAAGAVLVITYPKFMAGPAVDVDPRIAAIWLARASEMQPLLTTEAYDPARLLFYLGPALVCVPFLLWLMAHERHSPVWVGWLYAGMALALFLPLAMYRVRFAIYAEVLLTVVLVDLLARMRDRPGWNSRQWTGLLARALASAGLLVGFYAAGLVLHRVEHSAADAPAQAACRLSAMAPYLNQPRGLGRRAHTIVARIDFGPELLYRTDHAVVGTPYHRNRGILDTYRILTATDDSLSRSLVDRRGVDLILLCPNRDEKVFFATTSGDATLYRRLIDGRIPAWLRAVELPPELAPAFRLYEVIR